MRQGLVVATEIAVLVIDAMALLIVVVATTTAFISMLRLTFAAPTEHDRRAVWLRYARWLVAALTFQLAADIIESSITASWEAVGRLAVIAVIRTFLDYFLERDVTEVRQREHERAREALAPK